MDEFERWDPCLDPSPLNTEVITSFRGCTENDIQELVVLASVHNSLSKICSELKYSDYIELDHNKGNIKRSSRQHNYEVAPDELSEINTIKCRTPRVGAEGPTSFSSGSDAVVLAPVRSVPFAPGAPETTTATSLFVTRQYESISRRDIQLEELETRLNMLLFFSQATNAALKKNAILESFIMRKRLAELEDEQYENQVAAAEGLAEVEAEAREHLMQVQYELRNEMQREIARLQLLIEIGDYQSSLSWLAILEERERHHITVDADRGFAHMQASFQQYVHNYYLNIKVQETRPQNSLTNAVQSYIMSDDEIDDTEKELHVSEKLVEEKIQMKKDEDRTNEQADERTTPHKKMSGDNNSSSTVSKRMSSRHVKRFNDEAAEARNARMKIRKKNVGESVSAAYRRPMTRDNKSVVSVMSAFVERADEEDGVGIVAARNASALDEEAISVVAENISLRGVKGGKIVDATSTTPRSTMMEEFEARRLATLSRTMLAEIGPFKPFWGWMFKSTGVLMSWQRRFFILTKKGKMKYTTQDPMRDDVIRWVHLFNVEDITRIELDFVNSNQVRPPADQYHSHTFYVDAVHNHMAPSRGNTSTGKRRRFKFCCSSKPDLNTWMRTLRMATDVVYALEEKGIVQRSPIREHFRMMYAILSPLLYNARLSTSLVVDSSTGNKIMMQQDIPTYRRRVQIEDDIAALEAQQRYTEQKEKEREEEEKRLATLTPHRSSMSPPNPMLT